MTRDPPPRIHGGVRRVNNGGLVNHGSPIGAENGAGCRQLVVNPSLDLKLPDTASFTHDTGIQHDLIPGTQGRLNRRLSAPTK